MPTSTLHKSLLAKRLRSQDDTEMAEAQPVHHPARALPLTSYIGPPVTRSSPRKLNPNTKQKNTKAPNAKTPKAKSHKPARDRFFPSFPEPLCFELGCHSLSPHSHANGQHDGSDGFLPSAEDLRKAYQDLEVGDARRRGLRARPRYASTPSSSSSIDFSTTDTPRPSQKIRDAATARHSERLTASLPVSKQHHATAPSVSSPLKPPGCRMTSAMRRALPLLPKTPAQPRRKAPSKIVAPKKDLAPSASGGESSQKTLIARSRRMMTRSQDAGNWVRELEEGETLRGVMRGIEVNDLTGGEV